MVKKTQGTVNLQIKCGEVVKTKTFVLKATDLSINPVTSGLVLDFNPEGRSNQDIDTGFTYEGNGYKTKMTVSPNFD
jgi:hypothetical protein